MADYSELPLVLRTTCSTLHRRWKTRSVQYSVFGNLFVAFASLACRVPAEFINVCTMQLRLEMQRLKRRYFYDSDARAPAVVVVT